MKNLSLFLLVFFGAAQAHAQLSGIGIRPILSLSTYKLSKDYNDIYDANFRPGGGLAIFTEFNLGNRITFQPEIAFVQRGATLENESSVWWNGPDFGYPRYYRVTELRQKESLNYIDIPLMFEKNFGGGKVGAYVAAGATLSFSVGNGRGLEEITAEYPDADGTTLYQTDRNEYSIEMGSGRNDDYKGNDFSINLGTGLIYILEHGELGFDVRYTHGMRNIDIGNIKNRGFQIGLSYMYYFGQ